MSASRIGSNHCTRDHDYYSHIRRTVVLKYVIHCWVITVLVATISFFIAVHLYISFVRVKIKLNRNTVNG